MKSLTIDPAEHFPSLAKAPIVEAVIDLRARAEVTLSEEGLREYLTAKLPEYPQIQPQREIRLQAMPAAEGSTERFHPATWRGVRVTSADRLHIAQFNRDGFAFSRLAPYENWAQFCGEALRLWQSYGEFAKPSEVQRVGVRFINRIPMPAEGFRLQHILRTPPKAPKGLKLPVMDHLWQDTYGVPGYPYAVRRTQTIQRLTPSTPHELAVILDIDAFTTQPSAPTADALRPRLNELRWLKNKAFFGSLTARAIKTFQEGSE